MHLLQKRQNTSIVPFPLALCPKVVVVRISAAWASKSRASDKNCGAASECSMSGAPNSTILSKKGCSQVLASRSANGITTTYREVGSIRAKASVSPVRAFESRSLRNAANGRHRHRDAKMRSRSRHSCLVLALGRAVCAFVARGPAGPSASPWHLRGCSD